MNRRNRWTLLAMLISGVSTWKASANGFRLPDQDAFATARGEAFVATADNASAIYYNPAGITQLAGNNFRSGLEGIYYKPTFQPPNSGQTYNGLNNSAYLPQFFFTSTAKTVPFSFGLGVYAPYGGSMNWSDDTGFRTVATSGSLKYITINPVVAVKLSPSLSLGGGVMVNYVNMDMEQGLRPSYLPPAINFFRFTGDGWSVGYNLGLHWQPIDKISIGATFRSSVAVTLKGHTEFEQFLAGIPDTSVPASTDFTFPMTAILGISYRPTPKWNLEFDADYTDWSSFGTTTIFQQGAVPLGGPQNPTVTLDWQPSWIYEFGATRFFDNGWQVSAGFAFNENSVPDAYYTPLAADLNRYVFSVGAGRKGKRFDFDVAYQFCYGPTHTVIGSIPSSTPGIASNQNADGKYGFTSSAVIVSVGMHF
jgi:long-chain fatty acid transport protein